MLAWQKVMAANRRVYGFGHCRLTAEDWDKLRNHMPISSMKLPLPFPSDNGETIEIIIIIIITNVLT